MERNRILALVLALVLVAGIMPIHAFAAEPLDFSDVPEGFWAEEAIDYMSSNGYLLGNKDGTFGPTDSIMRKTVALLLYRIEGQPAVSGSMPFPDVGGKTYHDAILWASQAGIVTGYGDGTFRPDNTISRQHFAIMLNRYAEYKDVQMDDDFSKMPTDWTDLDEIPKSAVNACWWAYRNGIINGRADGSFDPKGNTTRAQLAVIMSRFLQKVGDQLHKEAVDPATCEHEWTGWRATQYATTLKEGKQRRVCTICGEKEYKVTPMIQGTTEGILDLEAAIAHGNAYANETYGWKIDYNLNENNAGFYPATSYSVAWYVERGGQEALNSQIERIVDMHHNTWVELEGDSEGYAISFSLWEAENGYIFTQLYYGFASLDYSNS